MKFKQTEIGCIPEHWKVLPIRDDTMAVTDYVANGSFASLAANVSYKDDKDVAVLIRLVDYNNNFQGNFVYIDDHAYNFLSKSKLYGGEIIISNVGANVGTVFRCPTLPYKMSLAPNSIMVKFNENNDFYFHWLKSRNGQQMIKSIVTGSAQPKFNKTNFRQMLVPVPPIEEQNRIAAILNAIDDKINKNRQINDNLLAQAQTLYKQFFPYSVQDDLPDGWRIGTVGEIIEIHDSKRIPLSGADRAKMEKKIYPYYGAASLMDFVDNYIFDGKYLLLGEDGTVVDDAGYPILQYVWGQFWVNNHAHILTGRLGYDVESLYMLFKQTPVKSIVTGAVQPKISQANLRSIQVVIPPEYNLREYNDLVEPLFSLFRANEEECKTLTALRDTLLPKLMSGEIDVSTVQL